MKIWIVFDTETNGEKYAFYHDFDPGENLKNAISEPSVIIARACATRKEAIATAQRWNAIHRANNEFMGGMHNDFY